MRHYTKILFICFCISILLGCTKTEFMPTPEGEIVPEEILPKLEEVLEGKEYMLFKKAWHKSNIRRIIQDEVPRNKLTILLPNDKAMEKAGYTSSSIEKMEQAPLESLVRYHILRDYISISSLSQVTADVFVNSLLKHPEFVVPKGAGGNNSSYTYLHVINADENGLIDNGISIGNDNEIGVNGGYNIIPINRILEYPKRQMIDVLREDSRFTLFYKSLVMNARIYETFAKENWSFPSFPLDFTPYKYTTDGNATIENGYRDPRYPSHLTRNTLFAPTDEAFRKLGIYTEEDLISLNNRSIDKLNWNDYRTALDSLLTHHSIIAGGRLDITIDEDKYPEEGFLGAIIKLGSFSTANTVFYSNSLNKETLENYMLINSWGNLDFYLNLDFGKDVSNRITVKHKGSSAEAASIVEENINTIQGPIHVVDRLIVPEGFSMWHKKN